MSKIITQQTKELINAWHETTKQIAILKRKESDLRDELVEALFPNRTEGTHRRELGAGYDIVATQRYTREVDNQALRRVLREFPKGAKKNLIKTSVSLIKKGYDALDDKHKAIFDKCLTIKPQKPSLRIDEPKDET